MTWDNLDSQYLRDFLSKQGAKLIDTLKASKPKVSKDNVESAAMSGVYAQGWEDCVAKLEALAKSPETKQENANYIDTSKD